MKLLSKVLTIILSVLFLTLLSFALIGCGNNEQPNLPVDSEQEKEDITNELAFVFETDYTENEHIQRIKEKTQERLASDFQAEKIKNYSVEILYSFYTDDPEWFLIEIEYKEAFDGEIDSMSSNAPCGESYTTRFKHIVGRIYCDKYYVVAWNNMDFVDGQSPYTVLGYNGYKKYYTLGQFAVEKDGKVLSVFRDYSSEMNYLLLGLRPLESQPWDTEKKVLSLKEQKEMLISSRSSHDANFYLYGSSNYYL